MILDSDAELESKVTSDFGSVGKVTSDFGNQGSHHEPAKIVLK